ncbi:hypothetical protein V1517DRAFT_327913 [Lipomyces orientalis]|uniref:Uncharacterized protein n=1 Tax=Lipomyces orientalis TaxID=1233043 RepID=A0ACC3TJS4_9ASCO
MIYTYTLVALQCARFAQVALAFVCLFVTSLSIEFRGYNSYGSSGGGGAYYLMGVSVWTLLASPFLVIAPIYCWSATLRHKLTPYGVELLTNMFWFTGFIVIAVYHSRIWCGGFNGTACVASGAAVAIAVVNWLLFIITSTLLGIAFFGRSSVTSAGAAFGAGDDAPGTLSAQNLRTLVAGRCDKAFDDNVPLMSYQGAGGISDGEPAAPPYSPGPQDCESITADPSTSQDFPSSSTTEMASSTNGRDR